MTNYLESNDYLKQIKNAVRCEERKEFEAMRKTEAYRVVFLDLIKTPLFRGRYNAKNSRKEFMFGVLAVMETISRKASNDEIAQKFMNLFFDNMVSCGVFEQKGK